MASLLHEYDIMPIQEPAGVDALSPSRMIKFSSKDVLGIKAKVRTQSETVLLLEPPGSALQQQQDYHRRLSNVTVSKRASSNYNHTTIEEEDEEEDLHSS